MFLGQFGVARTFGDDGGIAEKRLQLLMSVIQDFFKRGPHVFRAHHVQSTRMIPHRHLKPEFH